uniref:Uncharacterized protein n=1 Tax=Strigamia maritima TaxID=126957 RepID=T1JLZ5_STRMM
MQSSKHFHSSQRSQATNELLNDFSNVWKSVDKLKAGLARAEKQLVKAGSQDLEASSNISELTNDMLKTNKKPTRKVCKI